MRQPSRLACHSNCLRMTEEGGGNSEGMGAWQFLGNPRDKESGIFSPVHCLLPPPLRLARNALPALKMSLFCRPVSHRDACPLQGRGGLIFGRNFYRPERNSGVTCRTRQWRGWGRSSQSTLWRALLDTVPLTGSHKSLVWPAHKGWGEYYCRSRRVKLCCGPSQLGGRCVPGPGWCGPIGTLDAFLSLAAC